MNPSLDSTAASAQDVETPRADRPADPFQAYCEESAYYPEAAREQALKLLVHLAPYSDVVLVTGAEGSGKSLFLQRFLAAAGETWRVLSLRGGPALDDIALVDALDHEFSVRPDTEADRGEHLRRLRRNLHVLRRGALQPILVLDDAHLLPRSAYALFAELTEPREDGDKLLGIVLCGETETLREKLAMVEAQPLQPRIAHTFDLAPLSEADTAAYIHHRLTAAGCPEQVEIFTPAVIRFIRTASRGLPGRINGFARNLLQERGRRAEPAPVTSAAARDAGRLLRYGAVALTLSLLAVAYFYRDQFGVTMSDEEAGPEIAVLAPDEMSPGVAPSLDDPDDSAPDPEASFDADSAGPMPELEAAPPPAEAVPEAVPDSAPPEPEGDPAEPGDSPPREDRPAPGGDSDMQANLPSKQPIDSVPAAQVKTVSTPVTEAPAPASPPPAASLSAPSSPEARREAWLLTQPAEAFTLQLLASNEARILGFIEEHGLQDQAAVFQTRAGEQALYAVTWGVFSSRSEAARAAESEPMRAIRGVKPWIRPLRDIQGAIATLEASTAPAPNPM